MPHNPLHVRRTPIPTTTQVEAAWAARRNATGTIVIHDVQANAEETGALTEAQAADEEFARQLQAKLDAEEMARNRGRCVCV